MAQRMGRGIDLLFHDRGTRRGEWSVARPSRTLPPGNVIVITTNNLKSVLCLYESDTKILFIKRVCFPCKDSMLKRFLFLFKF